MNEPLRSDSTGIFRLGHAARSQLRWVTAEIDGPLEEARIERDLSPLAAIGLGQVMAAAVMMTRLIAKRPMRLLIEVAGDGPLGRIRAEADTLGHFRGLVENRLAAGEDGEGAPDLGHGSLRIVRQTPGKESYESRVELVPGGVARNLANFLEISEQVRSAVLLGVQARPDGVAAAGGVIIQAMPEADPDVLRHLEQHLPTVTHISSLLENGGSDNLLSSIFEELGWQALHESPLQLSCDCDRERFADHLRALARNEPDLGEDGERLRVQCNFCGADYQYRPDEIRPSVN